MLRRREAGLAKLELKIKLSAFITNFLTRFSESHLPGLTTTNHTLDHHEVLLVSGQAYGSAKKVSVIKIQHTEVRIKYETYLKRSNAIVLKSVVDFPI